MTTEEVFVGYSVAKLNQYYDRIEACIGKLTPEQVWMRSSETSNSAGNLLLHLAGNIRQWMHNGVDSQPLRRDRPAEFSAREGADGPALLAELRRDLDKSIQVIEALNANRLLEKITVQGHKVTVLEAIYHVVEHFSGHTGQIIFLTKALSSEDLGFYAYLDQRESDPNAVP